MWFYIGFATLFFLIPGALVSAAASASNNQVHAWLPNITGFGCIAFLAGTVLLFAGVEVQGARAK